jgi:hypothetical protein
VFARNTIIDRNQSTLRVFVVVVFVFERVCAVDAEHQLGNLRDFAQECLGFGRYEMNEVGFAFAQEIVPQNREEIFGFVFRGKQRGMKRRQYVLDGLGFGDGFRQEIVLDAFHQEHFGALFPYHQLFFASNRRQNVIQDTVLGRDGISLSVVKHERFGGGNIEIPVGI